MIARTDFSSRHVGPDAADEAHMLATVGVASLDELVERAVPAAIRRRRPLALPQARDEAQALAALAERAALNRNLRSLIGQGYWNTNLPAVIRRHVLENAGWITAYTPYQPEISQGRLEALLVFQTMVCDLTGLAVANASLLDEPTAAAEAMALAARAAGAPPVRFFVDAACHPQTVAVVGTRARALGIELTLGDPLQPLEGDIFGALLQHPGTLGELRDLRPAIAALRARGATVAIATDLLACTLLASPGELGADVAVGSAQRFGVPPCYGGPHAGFIAVRENLLRQLPGRVVGVTVDAAGERALRLALQTREQHIRREKATSNICTAQVLLAVIAAMYAVWHGPEGLRAIARRVHDLASRFARALEGVGHAPLHDAFFDTVAVRTGSQTQALLAAARERGFNLRAVDAQTVAVTFDETVSEAEASALAEVFGATLPAQAPARLPQALTRSSPFLEDPVFHRHRSETAMMRYLRSLAERDLALDRTPIPLGSCTMKLNPAAALAPIEWPAFAELHPFAPPEQARGYHRMIAELETWLAEITGYDAVSVQPNAGAQGEYAGLLAIRAYHEDRGEGARDVCLIPVSAHGTNPASAAMAGLRVVAVACDRHGNVDIEDFERKASAYASRLAAAMLTYPSTHGVFEEAIVRICEVTHRYGGQVYLDGANLNALVGVAAPGEFGADVSHLNLHKTFAIPHGGGGPGVGPLAVRRHLAPYLPGRGRVGPVAGAPYGSAGVLPISWMYIAMMGAQGLLRATRAAILAANYVAKKLAPHYPILYSGPGGLVAHECIVDLRPFRDSAGVGAEDVAKRLMDFGLHAPTMSFPVAGTLMIEPTESEPLEALDRFCEAMIAIRAEMRAIEEGRWPREDNPLRNAPHTAAMIASDHWSHPYTRAAAAFPLPWVRAAKYWPPVRRVDQVYGDRHFVGRLGAR